MRSVITLRDPRGYHDVFRKSQAWLRVLLSHGFHGVLEVFHEVLPVERPYDYPLFFLVQLEFDLSARDEVQIPQKIPRQRNAFLAFFYFYDFFFHDRPPWVV